VDSQQEWQIHDEVKRLASRQGIQVITGTVPLISSCDHFFSKALVK
jgi:hypothetical protein